MRAWVVDRCAPIDDRPLLRIERDLPIPAARQVLLRISCCGVCRTDLHLAEGDLPSRHSQVTPGHEIVGTVEALGEGVSRLQIGDRIGVAWLANTDQTCRYCRRGDENLCLAPTFTGWDVDGGYADYCVADEQYVYALPDKLTDEQTAPMLCAGIIGYRALKLAEVPAGGTLGIYGFGSSAHLTAQLALHMGMRVHVLTRGQRNRELAMQLGVDSASQSHATPPELLDAAILFAPAGDLVPVALQALDAGGTLAVAGIWMSQIPALDYATDLFRERRLRSVTANTRHDGEEFLQLAERFGLSATTTTYPMSDAARALSDLAHGRFSGSAVLHN